MGSLTVTAAAAATVVLFGKQRSSQIRAVCGKLRKVLFEVNFQKFSTKVVLLFVDDFTIFYIIRLRTERRTSSHNIIVVRMFFTSF